MGGMGVLVITSACSLTDGCQILRCTPRLRRTFVVVLESYYDALISIFWENLLHYCIIAKVIFRTSSCNEIYGGTPQSLTASTQ